MSGIITDGPGDYIGGIQCRWYIFAPPGFIITVTFQQMDTECRQVFFLFTSVELPPLESVESVGSMAAFGRLDCERGG